MELWLPAGQELTDFQMALLKEQVPFVMMSHKTIRVSSPILTALEAYRQFGDSFT
jgi:hypothetical protein